MNKPSPEQDEIVNHTAESLGITACAGSGKTYTAVRRLAELRRRMGRERRYVALLSFSNVAVDTFRQGYADLVVGLGKEASWSRVTIDTLDGFLTNHVLRPHAHRAMNCGKTPFLITGREPFLQNKQYQLSTVARDGKAVHGQKIQDVAVRPDGAGGHDFLIRFNKGSLKVLNGKAVAERLGAVGGYTHALGPWWALRTFDSTPWVLKVLAHRYRYVLVDEAQDLGSMHWEVLRRLEQAGVKISLIGDFAQAIYEFADADGGYLKSHCERKEVQPLKLTKNFRSVPAIVNVANKLAKRCDEADRPTPDHLNGAFFLAYEEADSKQLLEAFGQVLAVANAAPSNSAVLCRAQATVNTILGTKSDIGQGLVNGFANAALQRDKRMDYFNAYRIAAGSIVGLLGDPPDGLLAQLNQPGRYPEVGTLCRAIWAFVRNKDTGLPDSTLLGKTQWHPALVKTVGQLLEQIAMKFGYAAVEKWRLRVKSTNVPDGPLLEGNDLVSGDGVRLRVDTVHQAKGESLDAVLYIASKAHVKALVEGGDTEIGRIGYVAVTRARNLLWLAVPEDCIDQFKSKLVALGFAEAKYVA